MFRGGNFGYHPAATTTCRHCGAEIFVDEAEICMRCGPICGDCLNAPCPKERTVHTIEFLDTDSGLGIGGINNDQSLPVIPSERAIAYTQRLMETDVVCKRCGASQNFDGARFTTSGTNICDDCF